MLRSLVSFLLLLAGTGLLAARVPVIYTSDLFHPPDDPDDHYDLATLFALPELDVKAIVIDMANSEDGKKPPGEAALRQIFHLTGRAVPFATGLVHHLHALNDTGREQAEACQGGVNLILSTLRASEEKVDVVVVGSLLDVAAAFNREPELLREKVRAIHINAGNGPDGWQEEWNVRLDSYAYRAVMQSGLPIRWYPCFGRDGYLTYFRVDQAETLAAAPGPLRAFFHYALTRSASEPVAFLAGHYPAPEGPRNMWSTASLLDLAGRRIYATSRGYEALSRPPSPQARPVECYRLRPLRLADVTDLAEVPPPGPYARYSGRRQDLIGKTSPEPDGEPDCLAYAFGLPAGKAIAAATLHGPRGGLWLSHPQPERWLVRTDWEGEALRVVFSFWAAGAHRLELAFADGERLTLPFHIPLPGSPRFRAILEVVESDLAVFQQQGPEYEAVMASCLKNLLADFPIVRGAGQ